MEDAGTDRYPAEQKRSGTGKRSCRDFLSDLKTTHYENVLIVTHGALARAMIGAAKHVPHEHFWDTGVLSNCGTLEIEL